MRSENCTKCGCLKTSVNTYTNKKGLLLALCKQCSIESVQRSNMARLSNKELSCLIAKYREQIKRAEEAMK